MADEVVTQRLEFDASQALEALAEVDAAAETTAGKANLLNKKLQDYSRSLGQSWKQTLAQMKEAAGVGGENFTGFTTPLGQDVTADVFKQTEALAKATQAKNQYITEDSRAAASALNFDGSVKKVNVSVGEQSQKLQVLSRELNNLKYPTQGRNELGQFASPTPPSFQAQFASLSTYQEQLKLVQTTIANLQKSTNLPFKDVGAELGKSFPELLKDTNLVSVAVENLTKQNQGLSASFRTEAESIALVQAELTRLQSAGKLNFSGSPQKVVNDLKSVIKEVSQTTGTQYEQVGKQLQNLGVPAAQAQAAVRGLNKEMNQGVKEAGGFAHSIDIVRTALGTLVAVGIFGFLQLISQAFHDTVQQVRDLEGAIYNLHNAERILSQQGVEIAPKDLQDTIQGVQQLVPLISQVDATKAVSSIALFTKDLGFNKEQIDELSKSVATLYVRNKSLGLSFEQVRSQVLTGLLTGRAQGIRDLGVTVTDDTIKMEALRLGLVANEKAFNDLTGDVQNHVKGLALLSIVNKSTADEQKNIGQYLNTTDAQVSILQATWQNLLKTLGQDFAPVIIEGVKGIVTVFKILLEQIDSNQGAIRKFAVELAGLTNIWAKFQEINSRNLGDKIKGVFTGSNFKEIKQAFADGRKDAEDYFNSFDQLADTPTAAIDNFKDKLDSIDTTKAQNALRDLLKSLQDLQNQMAQKEADFQLKLQRFDQDSAIEREHIVEDYNLNVLQTQRQFALRQKEANDKYRQKEKDDERKFQEQMRQLREKFLYDLEDALRERDAKQVLRLIDKYNMEKQNMINENALRKKDADEQHKLDLEQMKAQEAERLQEMAEEQAVRLQRFDEEQALKRSRMEQDHAIEMARMKEQQDEIIRQASEKIAEEYGINEDGANALYGLLNKYYGTNGSLAQLTSQGYNAMLQQAGGFLAQVAAVIAQYQGMLAGFGGSFSGFNYSGQMGMTGLGTYVGGLAKGGQFVATKPTTATFGEGGEPELVTITPLSKLGSLKSKQPLSGVDGLNGNNGQTRIALDLNLSPDLEARVIQRSMDGTAEIVQRINRSKNR